MMGCFLVWPWKVVQVSLQSWSEERSCFVRQAIQHLALWTVQTSRSPTLLFRPSLTHPIACGCLWFILWFKMQPHHQSSGISKVFQLKSTQFRQSILGAMAQDYLLFLFCVILLLCGCSLCRDSIRCFIIMMRWWIKVNRWTQMTSLFWLKQNHAILL